MRDLLLMLARAPKCRQRWDDVTVATALALGGPATGDQLTRGLTLRAGRVYPALRRLLAAGRITEEWADGRRYYRAAADPNPKP
jgi:predicted transcriptional regulator